MSKNGLKAEEVTAFLEESRGLERNLIGEILQSRKRAWQGFWVSMFVTCLSVGAVIGLTPLKEPPEIHLVRVDKTTGAVEHVSKVGEVQEEDLGEALDIYFLNKYVIDCEGYNYHTIQTTHDTCALLSSFDVQQEYGQRFVGNKAVDKRLGQHANIDVDVHSITLNDTIPGGNKTATVRFSTIERDVSGTRTELPNHQIATIAFNNIKAVVKGKTKRINPIGFQVQRYQLNDDLSRKAK